METLVNLESFVRSAETGSFSAAARFLGLTPAAVSRNVTILERNLGVRLFQRSTREVALTEVGENFRSGIEANLQGLQAAIADVATARGDLAGVLKISSSLSFVVHHILPILAPFLERHPRIRPQWHFENRVANLISERFDTAIAAGFELPPGVVALPLAPAHFIAVASPSYMKQRQWPRDPGDLVALEGIVMRSDSTGRVRQWTMRNVEGAQMPAPLSERLVVNDATASCRCAVLGLGVALVPVPDVLHQLESHALVRLLPDWYADAGAISLYCTHRKLMPAKTRAFVDHVLEASRQAGWAQRFAAQAAGVDAGNLRLIQAAL